MSDKKEFRVGLWLDGYEDQKSHDLACEEYIYDQLNMTASSVAIEPFVDLQSKLQELEEMCEGLVEAARNLEEDCGCITPYRLDVKKSLEAYEAWKLNKGGGE